MLYFPAVGQTITVGIGVPGVCTVLQFACVGQSVVIGVAAGSVGAGDIQRV